MAGSIDIYNDRRSYHERCYFWKRDEDKPLEEYVHDHKGKTLFYAKDVSAIANSKNNISGLFLFDSSDVTLATPDSVDIKPDDVVLYEEQMWRVRSVQFSRKHKQQEFSNQVSKITYIELKA